ncbi:hypothetical protein LL251_10190 [Sphingobium naphthae]|nr:hypothetical protein [Sphingobium naphthae]
MISRNFSSTDSVGAPTSRRALLQALTIAPVAALAVPAPPWSDALARLHDTHEDEPAILIRTRERRRLSRVRYHRAEAFMPHRWREYGMGRHDFLYRAGIVAQLGLSAHLLDVGFSDTWNARHIGLRVAKSLAYANATGFGHDCPEMARLALVLTPYCRWNTPRLFGEPEPDDGGFSPEQAMPLLRALLDRVHAITGHPRPSGWQRRRKESI